MNRTDLPAPSFFEGTEKKVELVVSAAAGSLRARGAAYWRGVVEACGARILSHVGNDRLDAWLLSESSLFVWDHKMLMITCGRTRLTASVDRLLRDLSAEHVRFLAYERKNEVFPHAQATSFFEDVETLGAHFPGRAFQFANRDEHHLNLFHLDRPYAPDGEDGTLQVLMHGLDPRVRHLFGPDSGLAACEVAAATGLDGLLADAACDAHLFEPCGYSLNAIRGEHYATVHVTPDEGSSYASFESNLPGDVAKVLDVFRPRSFDLVLWDRDLPRELPAVARDGAFRLSSHVTRELSCGYHVQFVHLFRPGGKPRTAYELELRTRHTWRTVDQEIH